jgi:hypothetical protein
MRTRLICAGVILLGVVVNQSAIHWRSNSADSDLFAYYGWCAAHGARPYLDIWDNKPPGIWWASAAATQLAGPGVGSDLLLGSLVLLVTLTAFLGAARTTYHPSLSIPAAVVGVILLTDARFECGATRTETLVVACETAAICAYFRWLRQRRTGWLAAAGLLAGAAPLCKQSGLAAAAAITLHHIYVCARAARSRANPPWLPSAWLLASLTLAPAAAAIVLAWQGALGEALFAVGRFNRAYFAIGDATWLNLGQAWSAAAPALTPLAGIGLLASLGLAWCLCRAWNAPHEGPERPRCESNPKSKIQNPKSAAGGVRAVLFLWLALAAYFALIAPGRRGHHFMPLLPSLGLLTLCPLHVLIGARGLLGTSVARPATVGVLIVYAYVLATFGLGNVVELRRCWQAKPTWYALGRAVPTEEQQRAAEVVRRTTPDDTIYVWGWSPGTYRWAGRRAASRFATVEKFGQVGSQARFIVDGAVADIVRNRPRIIFLSPSDYAGIVEQDPGEFGRWLRGNYEKGPNVGGMYLLEQRQSEPRQSEPRP